MDGVRVDGTGGPRPRHEGKGGQVQADTDEINFLNGSMSVRARRVVEKRNAECTEGTRERRGKRDCTCIVGEGREHGLISLHLGFEVTWETKQRRFTRCWGCQM